MATSNDKFTDTSVKRPDKPHFDSFTGSGETKEPSKANEVGENNAELVGKRDDMADAAAVQAPAATSTPTSHPAGSVKRPSRLPAKASMSARNSANSSPKISREPSPIRPNLSTTTSKALRSRKNSTDDHANGSKGLRSRKNSVDEHSPSRSGSMSGTSTATPSVPSAAAVQRALSAVNMSTSSHSLSANDPTIRAPNPQRPQKKPSDADGEETTPHWPISPRLKSPPPPLSAPARTSQSSIRKADSTSAPPTPSIVLQRSIPASASATNLNTTQVSTAPDSDSGDQISPVMMRSSTRGISAPSSTLETVQEGSDAPAPAASTRTGRLTTGRSSEEDRPEKITENPLEDASDRGIKSAPESGTESGENNGREERRDRDPSKAATIDASQRIKGLGPVKSMSTIAPKAKTGAEGTQSMTVETETVSSIPQVAVGGGAGERSATGRIEGGSVRLKRSTETIRPKKEKKKVPRKTPSLNSGTASSKADVFEAKVASAVDEANSSDSEETFVYESNPPESHPPRQRHHSRTPSATSTVSLLEPQRGNGRSGIPHGTHSVAGKRSMKFVNNLYNTSVADKEAASGPNSPGLGRGTAGRGAGASHHHHIGQWGRPGKGQQHTSILDGDSPFPPGSRLAPTGNGTTSRHSSRPSSPRNPHHVRMGGLNAKKSGQVAAPAYDIDVEGADDEGTPLIGTIRANRSRFHRFPGSGSVRQAEYNETQQPRSRLGRFAGCFLVGLMVLLVVSGAGGFLFATTKALYGVRVHEIQNVLASEQEIMLDLLVEAINTNVVSVTVSDMDVNVFAKSRHVGTDTVSSPPILPPSGVGEPSYHTSSNKDEGNDPIPDPSLDSQTMLLGRIFEFDSALSFDGSPLARQPALSVGEVRLAQPGNKTESGGSARWERVIQHPFELIIRGVLKYQLPLSSRVRTVPIGASAVVHPEQGVDGLGRMRVEMLPQERGGNNFLVEQPKPKSKPKMEEPSIRGSSAAARERDEKEFRS